MNFDLDKFILWFFIAGIFLVLGIGPGVFIAKTITTQQALNKECKTNYSFLEVAVAGDNLSRLC